MYRIILPLSLTGLAVLVGVLLLPAGAADLEVRGEITFSAHELSLIRENSYDIISLPGWAPQSSPGEPALPTLGLNVALPQGKRVVRVVIDEVERVELPGPYRPLPAFGRGPGGERVRVEGASYQGEGEYPSELLELTNQGFAAGEPLASLVFHGVHWDRKSGALVLYTRVGFHLELTSATGEGIAPARVIRSSSLSGAASPAEVSRALSRGSFRSLGSFSPAPRAPGGGAAGEEGDDGGFILLHPGQYPALDGSLVEYLIITTEELAAEFQELADWKTRLGVPAAVRTLSQVRAACPEGVDLAEKIRLYVRDAFTYWGTRWVLLGGDNSLVPSRKVFLDYWYYPNGAFVATDLYYSSLDGNWDHDGDGIYGEAYVTDAVDGDWVDLYPEVQVGRAPVETVDEAAIFVDKAMAYQTSSEALFVRRALFCAEIVFPVGWEPGEPITLNGCDIAHDAGEYLPATWDTLYLCEWPHQNESRNSVITAINQGYHLVTVVGHGDAFKWSTGDEQFFMIDDAVGLTNSNRLSVFFYANCNTNQSDMECLNEYLMLNPGGGAVGCVATTDFDFPDVGRYYHQEFFRMLIGTDILSLGELQGNMKIPFIPQSQRDGSHRWTQMAYNLLGDPQLPLWRLPPGPLQVTHAGSLALGDTTYSVTVKKGGGFVSVNDALVTLWKKDTGEYARGVTASGGEVTLTFRPASLGEVYLGIFHPDYYPVLDTVDVVPGAPLVYLDGVTVDDDSLGASLGNGNGLLEAGERAELDLTLTNGGSDTTEALVGSLALLSGSRLVMDLAVDDSTEPGLLMLGQDRVHPAALPCTVGFGSPWPTLGRPPYAAEALGDTAADPQDSSAVRVGGRAYLWEDAGGWHLRAAGALEDHSFTGILRGDGCFRSLEPYRLESTDNLVRDGDSLSFSFAVDSTEAEDGFDLVMADSFFVDILSDSAFYGTIPPGESVTRTFLVEADRSSPDEHRSRLDLTAVGATTSRDEEVVLELFAPWLDHLQHAVYDTLGGDGDGLAEPGEDLDLRVTVSNTGGGEAPGVAGTLRALAGATVTESLAVFGDIAPGAEVENEPAYMISVTDSLVELELSLVSAYGHSWLSQFDIGVLSRPGMPTGLTGLSGSDWVELRWTPSDHPDLRGYHIYRGMGTVERVNDRLIEGTAFYRVEGLNPETSNTFRVTAVDSAGNESRFSPSRIIWTGPPYQAGWPALARNQVWGSPAIADLTLDGTPEVVVGSKDWRVFSWGYDGGDSPGWPRLTGRDVNSSPAVGDLDGDNSQEVVVGCDNGILYAWEADGSGYRLPTGEFADVGGRIRSTPTLADLDGDYEMEIIVGTDAGTLYVWHEDGTGYLNPNGYFADVSGPIISSAAVADVAGDSLPEVFINSFQGGVYAWHHDGTPVRLEGGLFRWIGGNLWSSPSLGDLDGNGSVEVVVAGGNDSVYAFTGSASAVPGWPNPTEGPNWTSPALADLDNDGTLEIIVGSTDWKVYAWHVSGADVMGWPVALPDSVVSSPVVGDLTGDPLPEVVVGCLDRNVYAIRKSGNILQGWPMPTLDRIFSTPAIGDLDGDGDVEVVCASYDGFVYAYDISATYDPETMDWPMFGHDRHRSGFAGWKDPFGTAVPGEGGRESLPRITDLAAPRPNPASGGASVSFQLHEGGRVSLNIYDVTGRRVRTLAADERGPGAYELRWDGRDGRGRLLGAGVYFLRLETSQRTVVRKMVVLP